MGEGEAHSLSPVALAAGDESGEEGVHCLLVHVRGSGPAPSAISDSPPRGQDGAEAGAWLYVGYTPRGRVVAWDISGGAAALSAPPAATFSRGTEPAHAEAANCLCCGDDDVLYTCGDDKVVRLWNTRTLENTHTLRHHREGVNSIAIHNTMLFSCDDGGKVCICDVAAGHQLLLAFVAAEGPVNAVAATPAGLWCAADDGARLWGVADRTAAQAGKPLHPLRELLSGEQCDGVAAAENGAVYIAVNPSAGGGGRLVEVADAAPPAGDAAEGETLRMVRAALHEGEARHRTYIGAADHLRCPVVGGGAVWAGCDDGTLLGWRLRPPCAAADGAGGGGAAGEGDAEGDAEAAPWACAAAGGAGAEPVMALAWGGGVVWCGNDAGDVAALSPPQ